MLKNYILILYVNLIKKKQFEDDNVQFETHELFYPV